MILHEPSSICCGAIITVQSPPQRPQHRHLLASMVRRVRDSPNHHPCARSPHVKEFRFGLPPNIIFRSQRRQPRPTVFRIALHEFQSSLRLRQWRRVDVNPQHTDEPQILTHALVHHLLVHAAPSRIAASWTHRKVLIAEFTPHAHHLHPLGRIRFYKKVVPHAHLRSSRFRRTSSSFNEIVSACRTTGSRPTSLFVSISNAVIPNAPSSRCTCCHELAQT